ncbi:hypothetical protein KIN20_014408 [Parelaphostrongylus tenuis]|uniref:Uncharacterized protein n=1 Tax=Parelaphostrongylus tenuis TaxID=148309 RepID=A0AAD5N385_PARTN|nr:hypothetical protein KIN20_014408 [Parelaphostrongylus tenuis]
MAPLELSDLRWSTESTETASALVALHELCPALLYRTADVAEPMRLRIVHVEPYTICRETYKGNQRHRR